MKKFKNFIRQIGPTIKKVLSRVANFLEENSNYISIVLTGLGLIPHITYVIAAIAAVYAICLQKKKKVKRQK